MQKNAQKENHTFYPRVTSIALVNQSGLYLQTW